MTTVIDPEHHKIYFHWNSVHLVTITVTESGYYTDANGQLDLNDPVIIDEINNSNSKTIYGYLRNAINSSYLWLMESLLQLLAVIISARTA